MPNKRLDKLLQKRNALRSTLEQLVETDLPTNSTEIQAELLEVTTARDKLSELDDQVLDAIEENEEQANMEAKTASDFRLKLLRRQVELQNLAIEDTHADVENRSVAIQRAKLPKLELPKFDGNPLNWSSFWDSYQSAVHDNDELQDIDKFNYLNSLLIGKAASAVAGLAVTKANYSHAVELLHKRFGRKQLLIDAHIQGLIGIPNGSGGKMRESFDAIERHIRGLQALGITAENYGVVITPIILAKFPAEVQYAVSLQHEQELWDLNRVREILTKEVEARNREDFTAFRNVKLSDTKVGIGEKSGKEVATVGSLANATRMPACCFCGQTHFPSQCPLSVSDRYQKAVEKNLCFVCMRTGHSASKCRSAKRCPCGKRHHQSICQSQFIAPPNTRQPANPTGQNGNSFLNPNAPKFQPTTPKRKDTEILKTAQAGFNTNKALIRQIASLVVKSGQWKVKGNIVFDTGGDRTLVTKEFAAKLKAEVLRSELLKIIGCGDITKGVQSYPVVSFGIQCLNGTYSMVEAVVVSTILCDISQVELNAQVLDYFKDYPLVNPDHLDPSSDNVEVLIGLDHYWDFITGPVVNMPTGPSAIFSTVGWILSGVGFPR